MRNPKSEINLSEVRSPKSEINHPSEINLSAIRNPKSEINHPSEINLSEIRNQFVRNPKSEIRNQFIRNPKSEIRRTFFLLLSLLGTLPTNAQVYQLEKLSERINTSQYNEISPIISIDGKTLYFTRVGSEDFERTIWIDGRDVSTDYSTAEYMNHLRSIYSDISGTSVFDPVHSDFNQDIWIAETQTREFDYIKHPDPPLNNALPNSICSLTPDPNEFVVVNQFSRDGGMSKGFSIVRNNDTAWADPIAMKIDNYEIVSKGISLTMSGDGKVLILSLPGGDSYGDNDLYICYKIGANHWSAPKNLGSKINTGGREVTPHLSADGRMLYFSSNRYPSLGGLDLFFSVRASDSWEDWSEPRHFVAPINSEADDSQPYFNTATGYVYFSSKRGGTSDIYRVKIAPPQAQKVMMRGKIINTKTNEVIDAKVMYGDTESDYFQQYVESKNGHFVMAVPQGKNLRLAANRPGFITHEVEINYDANAFYPDSQEIVLLLDPISNDTKISLKPVYFERSKPSVMKKSYKELDYLVEILKLHPEINILIEGHTDNQGSETSMMTLSDQRAKEVRKYLIKNKIKSDRIEARGMGASKPISNNTSEAGRQLNRRVEVKITKTW
jgi:OmpA-OmpF porin, OOP family